jgi:hypothetical protein
VRKIRKKIPLRARFLFDSATELRIIDKNRLRPLFQGEGRAGSLLAIALPLI